MLGYPGYKVGEREGFIIDILGSILGITLTLNLNDVIASLGVNLFGAGYTAQQLPIKLVSTDVMVILISALSMSFLATLYPAYRASKTQPVEVLSYE